MQYNLIVIGEDGQEYSRGTYDVAKLPEKDWLREGFLLGNLKSATVMQSGIKLTYEKVE